MTNPEYMLARKLGLRAMSIEPSACVADGEAACCTSQVPITKGDIEIIVGDVRKEKISREVVDAAINRSKNPERSEKCPFLDTANRCSIYESRPVVCITWGIGGNPVPLEDRIDVKGIVEEAEPGRVLNAHLVPATCFTCHIITAWDTTSVEALILAKEANNRLIPIIKNGQTYMITDFVRNELPHI